MSLVVKPSPAVASEASSSFRRVALSRSSGAIGVRAGVSNAVDWWRERRRCVNNCNRADGNAPHRSTDSNSFAVAKSGSFSRCHFSLFSPSSSSASPPRCRSVPVSSGTETGRDWTPWVIQSFAAGRTIPHRLFARQRKRSAESFGRYITTSFGLLCCLRTHALAARLYQNRLMTLEKIQGASERRRKERYFYG